MLIAPGGAAAIGMALKLARLVTGRFKTISMWDSFHGASPDAISIGGEAVFRWGIGPLAAGRRARPALRSEPLCVWLRRPMSAACERHQDHADRRLERAELPDSQALNRTV